MADRAPSTAQRRAARASWPVARFRLGDEPSDDLSETTTAAERIAMMWPLAQSAWRVADRPLPTYTRQDMPSVIYRAGDVRPADDDA